MRLLLVEDDPLLGDGIRVGLQQSGFVVDWVKDGLAAKLALEAEAYALVVLDLGLPRLSGTDLLKWLRATGNDTPVLILTARDAVGDRVGGLDAGADDYLIKPFDLDELSARIRALLRRAGGRATPLIVHGQLEIDPASRQVTLAGKPVELSPREYAILLALLEGAGRALSREQLEQGLYGWGDEVESNAVEVHIHHLRKKLGAELIRTIRGVGYLVDKA
ncbi:MAG: response regulator [Gammaproteobacteria bacterium]|nr:response regulator [Gammaproteobacteria bacterium]MBU1733030.1 response regulator [Gammaproteobacteria bacterium]MBU1892078.1 response regulator [Gammaproteobacteria bacterium]